MADEAATSTAPTGFYTRKATGLVRGISVRDSFVMNVAFINIALGALGFTIAPYAFPGVNLFWSVALTTALTMFPTVMYAMLSATMPRSGGDYVFVSRILHPAVGFMANFNTTVWMTFFTGILASWVSGFAGSSVLLTMGTVLDSPRLISWSSTAASKNWQFGVGLVVIALFTILVATGTRMTFRVLGVMFAVMVACQLVAVAVLLFHSHADFVKAYDHYASYTATLASAHHQGFTWPDGFSFKETAAAMPLFFSSLGYGIISMLLLRGGQTGLADVHVLDGDRGRLRWPHHRRVRCARHARVQLGVPRGHSGALDDRRVSARCPAVLLPLRLDADQQHDRAGRVIASRFRARDHRNIPPMFMVATRNILRGGSTGSSR